MLKTTMQNDLAILILAAGSSSRLGTPKQLVMYEKESLLRRSVKQALALSRNVCVVVGHLHEVCREAINDLPVQILYHKEYAKGMGSSLAFGISHTMEYTHTLIMLCDQPFIPLSHYHALLEASCEECIVASVYQGEQKRAVPALFPKRYYEALMKLDADKGAQSLLKYETCLDVALDQAYSIDIDTLEDVQTYLLKE